MTAARAPRTGRGRNTNKETPVLEAVQDETETATKGKAPRKSQTHRDLTQAGIGMIGGFEDAEPNMVPPSGKAVDVSYLFEPMHESFQHSKWKSQVVSDEKAAERAIRLAAMKLNYGVVIRTEAVTFEEDGETREAIRVFFKAGEKKRRKTSQGE